MNRTSTRLHSFSVVVDCRTVEEAQCRPCDTAWCEDETGTTGTDLRLPGGVTSLQHWLDLNG